ncbi:AAA family ATPase [Streptomyces sp. NPDC000151]|uniref:ATP-binding protein n=1 Tax=Streptomyces sp. NPDC000151 TaxID=3154244 RepID=UPI003328EB09
MKTDEPQHRRGNLPVRTTRLIGREAELAEVRELCERSRLVTLTGVGGVGKTRLALAATVELQPHFPDGAWLVELSPLTSAALLPHTIAEALPLVDRTTRPMIDVLADYLADRRLLLVLDTCEHLTDAVALTVQVLLRAAPQLRILATSRRVLDVPGEEVLTVEPLPVPDSADIQADSADAVTLLAERAAEAVPGFTVTDANRADVLGLCQRLDGLPLALELAAARLRELPVRELTARLEDRFAVLGDTDDTTSRADPPWHRALRTAIGWSHQLCSPAERLLWARLSVFAGTFDAETARTVCADEHLPGEQVPDLLDALTEKSILAWQPTGGGERYRMLDTIREYGADWLRALDEENALRNRHRYHYVRLARAGDAAWLGPDQLAWYDCLSSEHDNLRAALDFCLAEPADHSALDLAGSLWFFWFACGHAREGRHYLERALELCREPGPRRAKALWAGGLTAVAQGDADALARLVKEFRESVEEADDPTAPFAVAYLDCVRLVLQGDARRAVEVFRAAPDSPGGEGGYEAAWLIHRVGWAFTHTQLGEYEAAAALADAVCTQCGARGERWTHAWGDHVRAVAALGLGRWDEAVAHARAAVEGKAQLHDSLGIAMGIDVLASAAAATGRGDHAARLLGIAQQVWLTLGRPQLGMPGLVAAREATERRVRHAIGDTAYEKEFATGLETHTDNGIAYALDHALRHTE